MNRHLFEDRKRRKLFIKSFENQTLIGTLKGGLDDVYRKSYYDLKARIDKTTKEVKELYEMAKEQDSDNVNLIDRLELILKKLRGEDNENR